MTKFFSLFFALFLVANILSAQDLYKVKADKLNVRETSDPKSKIVGYIKQDENVAVLDSADKKYKVKVTNGEGWVSKEFLTKIQSAKPVVQAPAPKLEIPTIKSDYTNLIVLIVLGVILITAIVLAIKYSHSYVTISLCVFVVLAIGYFTYDNFFKPKNISGFYINTEIKAQYESFDFKSKDSVLVKDFYADSTFTTKYAVDGNMIKFYDNQNLILLLIQNDDVLIGEGFTVGTFKRK
jgi:hypothetical protein